MSFISDAIQLLNLSKESPAIGFISDHVITYRLPEELPTELESITVAHASLFNYSNDTIKNIKIFYSGEHTFTPKLTYRNKAVSVEFTVDSNKKVIHIKDLMPDETISIEVFQPNKEFKFNDTLINGSRITPIMQKKAESKHFPSYTKFKLLFGSLTLFIIYLALYSTITMTNRDNLQNQINESLSAAGYGQCIPEEFVNPVGQEALLERRFNRLNYVTQRYILDMNNVNAFNKLKLKDKILFCEPIK